VSSVLIAWGVLALSIVNLGVERSMQVEANLGELFGWMPVGRGIVGDSGGDLHCIDVG